MQQHVPAHWQEMEEQGTRLRLAGKLAEAVDLYRSAIRVFPGNVALLNSFGLVLLEAGSPVEARAVFDSAVACSPDTPALLFNLGNALRMLGESTAAIREYERALALGLERPEVYNNLGVALQTCERWDDALGAFEKALAHDPLYLPGLANCGNALIQLCRPDQAVEPLRRAIGIQPGYADAHWLLSHALLVNGLWPEGWGEYEWRWHRMKAAPYHRGNPGSWWRGEDIVGKNILLYAEQGMGDAVQFVRYAPLVKARGATVTIECHAGLVDLLRSVDGVSVVHARGEAGPRFDVACPLLSLPAVFRTAVDDIPGGVPYVRPDAGRALHWRRKLEPFAGLKRVGLVWAGNAAHTNDRKRSIPFEQLAPLAAVSGVQFISLQKEDGGDPRGADPKVLPLVDWTADLHDFADTAALISVLDLVITVDTAVAHVAGALNAPVWMMVPFTPDWRWFLHRADSPWYPSMRLFRQSVGGGWGEVVAEVCRALVQGAPSFR
jgi:Tfp pilus assembly protein PilF